MSPARDNCTAGRIWPGGLEFDMYGSRQNINNIFSCGLFLQCHLVKEDMQLKIPLVSHQAWKGKVKIIVKERQRKSKGGISALKNFPITTM